MNTTNRTDAFEINGRTYTATADALRLMRKAVPAARATGDWSAVAAIMLLGEMNGEIRPA